MGVVYVTNPLAPQWGIGAVVRQIPGRVEEFFLSGGLRKLSDTAVTLETPSEIGGPNLVLSTAAALPPAVWARAHHNVYVIELDPAAARDPAFALANPAMTAGASCVYVGLTGLDPEERLKNHQQGHQPARIVRRFGRRLLPELYRHFNPIPYELAQVLEPALAEDLRRRGYGAWQH